MFEEVFYLTNSTVYSSVQGDAHLLKHNLLLNNSGTSLKFHDQHCCMIFLFQSQFKDDDYAEQPMVAIAIKS